jgi:serine/threonine protein kinase
VAARYPETIGPYRVEAAIGMGGMGEVLRAQHEALGRVVAIKLRARSRGGDELMLSERFRHTASLQGELDHPGITRVYDYIEQPGFQALVLEYLGGGSVADLVAGGPASVAAAVEMGIRTAEALHFAHGRGVVHRDIKPANLMLVEADRPDTVRITDFGVAKTTDRSPHLTVVGANVGTVWYMSPEQFNHEDPTASFDVYSLGATLYEMLSGQIPFEGKDTAEIFARFLDGVPPPALVERNPRVPASLATVVEAAMALEPRQRVPTAAVLALLLRAVAEREGLGLSDAAARRLFRQADGAELRLLLRRLEGTSAGRPVVQAVTALDMRLNGATAITRIEPLPTPPSILAAMLEDDEQSDEEEDHTLVSLVITPDGEP